MDWCGWIGQASPSISRCAIFNVAIFGCGLRFIGSYVRERDKETDRISAPTRCVSEGEPPSLPLVRGYESGVAGSPSLTLRVSNEFLVFLTQTSRESLAGSKRESSELARRAYSILRDEELETGPSRCSKSGPSRVRNQLRKRTGEIKWQAGGGCY